MKYISLFTTLLAIGVLNSVSFAESRPQDYPVKIQNKAQAVKLSEGRKVAFVCEGCKTFQPSTMDKKKSFLSFFTANDTHGYPGCGGQVTVKALPGRNIKVQNTTVYIRHTRKRILPHNVCKYECTVNRWHRSF